MKENYLFLGIKDILDGEESHLFSATPWLDQRKVCSLNQILDELNADRPGFGTSIVLLIEEESCWNGLTLENIKLIFKAAGLLFPERLADHITINPKQAATSVARINTWIVTHCVGKYLIYLNSAEPLYEDGVAEFIINALK
jgi:hypothetical protein